MPSDPSVESGRLPPGWLERADTRSLILGELAARRHHRRTRRRRILASAAGLLVLAGLAVLRLPPTESEPSMAAVATAPAREILPDGSLVFRKGDAELAYDFSGRERRVELRRGTVHFDVAKDPMRPFVVTAGAVAVRAVGTAFSVEFDSASVEVLVTEGKVAVAPAADAHAADCPVVEAGRGVMITTDPAAPAMRPTLLPMPAAAWEGKLAWRARQLEFDRTPLAEAIRQLNAYNRVQFVLEDPTLTEVRLSGVLRADRIDGVIRLLEEDCGVQADRRDDARIVLRRAR